MFARLLLISTPILSKVKKTIVRQRKIKEEIMGLDHRWLYRNLLASMTTKSNR
jgi:hypothetical protein